MKLKIDPDHPLAKGLIGCWVPGLMKGIDLTGNCQQLFTQTPGGTTQNEMAVASEGPAYGLPTPDVFNSPILFANAPSIYTNWTELSMYYRGDRNGATSSTGNNPYFIWIAYDNGIITPYVIAGMGGTGVDLSSSVAYWNSGGVFSQSASTTSFDAVGTISALATFKETGNVVLYKNGVQVLSDLFSIGAGAHFTGTSPKMCINGWAGSGVARNSPTLAYVAFIWNRQLTAYEAALLDADPYGFLIPDEGEWPAIAAAAAGVATQYAAFSLPQHSLAQVIQKMIGY